MLVGAAVLDAVAGSFQASEGTPRHLAERLIAAMEAGQRAGGDARKGKIQSAAVIVADPRPGHSRRDDALATHINVCEHPTPIAEMRRIYESVSQTLGYRELQQFAGKDVVQLRKMLGALGLLAARDGEDGAPVYDQEVVDAVEAFRQGEGLATAALGSPAGLVDAETIQRLWDRLEEKGLAEKLRREFIELTRITR